MAFDVDKIRKDFPIFEANPSLIYLDSAATSQRPAQVIDTVSEFSRRKNSNIARGLYPIAEEATLEFENVRKKARGFIGAKNETEIIFTKNTTEGANLVMRGWGEKFIKKGDKIVTTITEHHSNFVPWQYLAKSKGAKLEVLDITDGASGMFDTKTDGGELDESLLEKKLQGAKLVAFSAASNVLGTINNTKKICKIARDAGAVSVVDGAQSVPSMPTDVNSIDCDFLMFSGHKMLAPFGVGILYGREELLEAMDPFVYGSEMIRSVSIKKTEWNDLPYKFESGTPAVDSVIGLGAALDYLRKVGLENIRKHEEYLVSYSLTRLSEVPGLKILGPVDGKKRVGLVSFTLDGIHPHDVAAMLAEDNICVRSGHHCAMPLHDRLGIMASTRASVYLYNKKEEIDSLVNSLLKVRKIFRK